MKQEPVAWVLTDYYVNQLQINSIQRLIDRAAHAHMIDIKLRINGQDEWYEVDWLKHLTRTEPPKREWVDLTNEELAECWDTIPERAMRRALAKLKEKNG